ncbi:MAG: hypothetical protein AAF357_14940, partial [Verrucomicrobiota bacterium]
MKSLCTYLSLFLLSAHLTKGADVSDQLARLNAVGPEGKGNAEAAVAWTELTQSSADAIVPILSAMSGASPLAMNWMRSAAEAILAKESSAGSEIPSADIQAFLLDRSHDPKARHLAYDFLLDIAPEETAALVAGMSDDPSPPLRRVAVAKMIEEGKEQLSNQDEAIKSLRAALDSARDVDQIDEIAKLLQEDLEQSVDLPTQFGFLMRWHLIAPF